MAYINVETRPKIYAKVYRILNGTPVSSINIRTAYPNIDYTQLTTDDFICTYLSDNNYTRGDGSTGGTEYDEYYIQLYGFSINPSYNPSTGILSLSWSGTSIALKDAANEFTHGFDGLKCAVYMIVDGVREEYT